MNSNGIKNKPGNNIGKANGITQGNNVSFEGRWHLHVPPQGQGLLGPLLRRLFICINILLGTPDWDQTNDLFSVNEALLSLSYWGIIFPDEKEPSQ
jgi:hypothetical protein